jgi:hypothetical protein
VTTSEPIYRPLIPDRQTDSDTARQARWDPDGCIGELYLNDGWVGRVRLVEAWYEPESRLPEPAWVVEWFGEGTAGYEQALLELGARPALDLERMTELSDLAASRIVPLRKTKANPLASSVQN